MPQYLFTRFYLVHNKLIIKAATLHNLYQPANTISKSFLTNIYRNGNRYEEGNCSKILKIFSFCSQMLVIQAGIHKMLARIANREDPDQTASEEAV